MTICFPPHTFPTKCIDLFALKEFDGDPCPKHSFEELDSARDKTIRKWAFHFEETGGNTVIILETCNDDADIKTRRWRYEDLADLPLNAGNGDEFVLDFGRNPIELFD